jgi:hypothetical protein
MTALAHHDTRREKLCGERAISYYVLPYCTLLHRTVEAMPKARAVYDEQRERERERERERGGEREGERERGWIDG